MSEDTPNYDVKVQSGPTITKLPATEMFGSNLNFSYDELADIMEIEGIRYSGELFRQFGRVMPLHTPLKIISRHDGVLVVAQIEPGDPDWKG
jgi:hypothetical protein